MFLHLILALSFLMLAMMLSSFHPQGWQPGLHNGIFFLAFTFSSWKFFSGIFLYRRVREKGWEIPFHHFAWRFEDIGLFRKHLVPPMDDFRATPFYSEEKTTWQNFREALLLARGWDVETRSWREYVPLFTPQVIGTEEFISEILRDEGFIAIFYSSTAAEGAYGARNFRGKTIYVPQAQFKEAHTFLSGYFENNEIELLGLADLNEEPGLASKVAEHQS